MTTDTLVDWCTLQWRHNDCNGVSNHRHLDCLLRRLFKRRSKKISSSVSLAFVRGNPPVTNGFPSQRANNAGNVSIWWCNHEKKQLQCAVDEVIYFFLKPMHYRCTQDIMRKVLLCLVAGEKHKVQLSARKRIDIQMIIIKVCLSRSFK